MGGKNRNLSHLLFKEKKANPQQEQFQKQRILDDPFRITNNKYSCKGITLQKYSDIGPSFSEAVNSCTTFSSPLLIACISSAKYFNCIYKIVEPFSLKCTRQERN